jgi:acyl carrier protein
VKADALRAEVRALVGELMEQAIGLDLRAEPDEPLLSSGVLDSMTLIELLERLRTRLGLVVDPLEVTVEHFDSLARIEAYVLERLDHE